MARQKKYSGKGGARKKNKQKQNVAPRRRVEFKYKGFSLEELQEMPIKKFMEIVPSRQRRTMARGITPKQRKLVMKIKKARRLTNRGKDARVIRTHCRDFVITPEMIGLTFGIYNGKEFKEIKLVEETVGRFLGEMAPTRGVVQHGSPGMGATRGSMFVPIK
ncbi:30S ribosomal protein S19 [Methanococcus maripaludis]|uniref:Small ribosomal subunit protein uS19 n=3 Tax=Methanococcus maripaludis TaxID=39152 RepID=RS19_METMP|nr:30S ribosomal protein S19 [Methanococcus maripaludis]Q6LX07.1 RecName: Full=Small ribosomal subunit protein uS19; AltName: Full=30S ribosomal protein S19 [Methanococcus maripaludis S2]AVB76670.1 30S ribosomal protein S19 [Methanococcus maripaludis]MBA2847447.1 small subunit ribosomal protein S19 [Methanococcus maripaludis]MBA2850048.1 small subunit ribosomal protein S19 [Methanococcus maripaludis]MBA2857480.1 small subunit ribosomal protein S19 [Methanococcus maripaludis]MBA2863180.1 small